MPEFALNPSNWKPAMRPGPVTLRGRTVTLEPLDAGRHTTALWQILQGQDQLWTWMSDGPFHSEDELRQALASKQADPAATFLAILPAATGLVAGWASLMRPEPAHGVIEVGNIVLTSALQRTTAATEGMYLMARHVFDQLGYRRYEWKCDSGNLASRHAAERLGFTFEGIFRKHMIVKGRNRDTAWYAMLDRDWPSRKRAFEAWLAPGNFDGKGIQRDTLEHFQQSMNS